MQGFDSIETILQLLIPMNRPPKSDGPSQNDATKNEVIGMFRGEAANYAQKAPSTAGSSELLYREKTSEKRPIAAQ